MLHRLLYVQFGFSKLIIKWKFACHNFLRNELPANWNMCHAVDCPLAAAMLHVFRLPFIQILTEIGDLPCPITIFFHNPTKCQTQWQEGELFAIKKGLRFSQMAYYSAGQVLFSFNILVSLSLPVSKYGSSFSFYIDATPLSLH